MGKPQVFLIFMLYRHNETAMAKLFLIRPIYLTWLPKRYIIYYKNCSQIGLTKEE